MDYEKVQHLNTCFSEYKELDNKNPSKAMKTKE
jgi:hypothetical protein